jgi:Asp-tRNA(Asn)/Glu-tRNA(Gln) amidotransferase B subunit
VSPSDLAELINLAESGRINLSTAKKVFSEMVETGRSALEIVTSGNLEQITDKKSLRSVAETVIAENPEALAKYLDGNKNLLKYFIGQLMKATQGKADPSRSEFILKRMLGKR